MIGACFERLFLGKELSLEAHLDSLSTMAHLLLVLFHRNGTNFVPAQHYSNTQRMIRGHFWSVATAQVHEIDEYYLFLDTTDPLEQTFGIWARSSTASSSRSGSRRPCPSGPSTRATPNGSGSRVASLAPSIT